MKTAYSYNERLEPECYDADENSFASYHPKLEPKGSYFDYAVVMDGLQSAADALHIDRIKQITILESKFKELSAKWKRETGLFSTTFDKINETYLDIIALGPDIIPFMLMDMMKPTGTAHWHTALKTLSKDNPLSIEELQKNKIVKEKWLVWGRKKNYIA